jgi:tRNA(adenine34) deaminase
MGFSVVRKTSHILTIGQERQNITMDAQFFMNAAYQEALKAFDEGEVPVGAVVEKEGRIIGRGYNRMEKCLDPTAHAEILAIGAASTSLQSWRLEGCTLFVTLEPCLMCLGAILQSRIDSIAYATADPRLGALDTFYYRQEIERAYGYFPVITSGTMRDESAALLRSFFIKVRKNV